VFITECEFDNTDLEGSASVEWRHVSGVHTLRSVHWCLNPLYSRSGNFVNTTAHTAAIGYRYVDFKISKYKNLFIR
jgi:hypothetical protein